MQDQHFDITERSEKLDKAEDDAASAAFDAVVEGDAIRIENAWAESLSKAEKKALKRSEAEQGETFRKDAADVPEVVQTLMTTEYVFGEALLHVAEQDGGDDTVNDLFEDPPTTEEHEFDPWTHIEDHDKAARVPEPDLDDGERKFDEGPFGAIGWLLLLAERIPVRQALEAVDGWGGDAYVGYERDDVSCMKVLYEGDTSEDLDQMHDALTDWTQRLPNSPASVRLDGSRLLFASCDPGPKATAVATGGSDDAVSLAVSRTYLTVNLEQEAGFPTSVARCSATGLLRDTPSLSSTTRHRPRTGGASSPPAGPERPPPEVDAVARR